eukprot:SAG31_NODE_10414_length_1141_cov_1.023992_1_plen_307_part_10
MIAAVKLAAAKSAFSDGRTFSHSAAPAALGGSYTVSTPAPAQWPLQPPASAHTESAPHPSYLQYNPQYIPRTSEQDQYLQQIRASQGFVPTMSTATPQSSLPIAGAGTHLEALRQPSTISAGPQSSTRGAFSQQETKSLSMALPTELANRGQTIGNDRSNALLERAAAGLQRAAASGMEHPWTHQSSQQSAQHDNQSTSLQPSAATPRASAAESANFIPDWTRVDAVGPSLQLHSQPSQHSLTAASHAQLQDQQLQPQSPRQVLEQQQLQWQQQQPLQSQWPPRGDQRAAAPAPQPSHHQHQHQHQL